MLKRRWPTQNEPNGVLVDFFFCLKLILLCLGLKKFLLVFCWYIAVLDIAKCFMDFAFVFVCVCVSHTFLLV